MMIMKLKKNRKSNSKHNNIAMKRYNDQVATVGDKIFLNGEYIAHILKNKIIVFPEYDNNYSRVELLQLSGELNRGLSTVKQ